LPFKCLSNDERGALQVASSTEIFAVWGICVTEVEGLSERKSECT
jgi:hypothetical protein